MKLKNDNDPSKRRSRNVSLTSASWEKLGYEAKSRKLRSRSELIEQIGLGKIALSSTPNIAGSLGQINYGSRYVPTPVRLESIYKKKNSLLRSITASVYRYKRQLGSKERGSALYKSTKNDLIDAAKIIELFNHKKPGYAPESMSALIKWVGYNILFGNINGQNSEELLEDELTIQPTNEELLWKISFTLYRMESRYPKDFKILESRYIYKKSYGIIVDYLERAHGDHYTTESIREATMTARSIFRAFLHELEETELKRINLEEKRALKILEAFPHPPRIEAYCELARLKKVGIQEHKTFCDILQDASSDLLLDFWINEFDHLMGHEMHIIERQVESNETNASRGAKKNIPRSKPSYSDDEQSVLKDLEKDTIQGIGNLREEIGIQYSLMKNLGEFDTFLMEKIKEISGFIWHLFEEADEEFSEIVKLIR